MAATARASHELTSARWAGRRAPREERDDRRKRLRGSILDPEISVAPTLARAVRLEVQPAVCSDDELLTGPFVPLHLREPIVIVGQVLQVRQSDLAGEDGIVVRDVGLRIPTAMFELDSHPAGELLEVEPAFAKLMPRAPATSAACARVMVF
jgi:hypothetical protein